MKITKEVKYNYVMRYLNGESPTALGNEVNNKVKSPRDIIFRWRRQYDSGGIEALDDKRGKTEKKKRKKKERVNYNDLSREDLIKYHEIKDMYIDELEKLNRPRFRYPYIEKVRSEFKISVEKICILFGVSKSGYYSWLKEPKTTGNFDNTLLRQVKTIYEEQNGNYGADRIVGALSRIGVNKNIKTVFRYMKELNIQALIRNPNKRKKKTKVEKKDTKDLRRNYINCRFNSIDSREKVFTDTTQWHTPFGKVYFSAVVSSRGRLYSLNISRRNDTKLVTRDIEQACKKIGTKFFIQFDNASFYKTDNMQELITKYKGIQSFGKAGESKANWPIENFWSILKQEYLRLYKGLGYDQLKNELWKIMFHYNHIRIQKKLGWKTLAEARV